MDNGALPPCAIVEKAAGLPSVQSEKYREKKMKKDETFGVKLGCCNFQVVGFDLPEI